MSPAPDRPDPVADHRLLATSAAARFLPRDVVAVRGPDALEWLQGQLSQDLAGLADGGSAESLLLSPQGKLVAYLRVGRLRAEELVLDVEGGFGPAVLERLARFKLRVRAEVEPLAWACLAVRGPRAAQWATRVAGARLAAQVDWPGFGGVDLLGPQLAPPEGLPMASEPAWEAARIEAGQPRMGAELDEGVIPAEAGLVGRAVSLDKGCYTGQELVARLEARGSKVARHLRGVVVEPGALPPRGAELSRQGRVVGRLTSVAPSPRLGRPVGLAFVHRSLEPPSEVELAWSQGRARAQVEELPLAGRTL
ncbi:MAG TPA: glycine cleavage T C-terminal barrel domain-containing protein [Acidimicrobiales bacterium]|nr:glycine cleavage T C-terminal barrel domain-containing protein [Acidimicrobiales bacterium]